MASDSVPMSNGFWSTPTTPIPVILPDPPPEARSSEPKQERKYHYKFDVDHNGLDINGFILQTDKHKGKRHKFRVYLDSNENGRFDKKDELIGRSGLKQKHAAKGVGSLLDEGELGQLEVIFKKTKSNASMREDEDVLGEILFFDDDDSADSSGNVVDNDESFASIDSESPVSDPPPLPLQGMTFIHPDGSEVGSFITKAPLSS